MNDNSNYNSCDNFAYQQKNSFKFLIRLRGKDPFSTEPQLKTDHATKQSHQKTKFKSPERLFYPRTNSKPKKPSKPSLLITPSLNQSAKYSVFTSNPPSDTLIVTSKPISGKLIDLTYKTPNDLYVFSQSILKESSLLQYDKVYNETSPLDRIYSEHFEERVNDLFRGKDSAAFFFGPKEGGKSYTLRGGRTCNEPGLLNKIIEGVLNLIEVSKQSYINDRSNQIAKSFVVKMQVYQVYQERVSDLIGIEGRMIQDKEIRSRKEYDDILNLAIENRKNLAQKLKVNELKRKSSLVIKILLEKISRDDNRLNVFKYAQMTLVELPSSNISLMLSKDEENKIENDPSPSGVLYRNTKGMLMNLRDALTASSNGLIPSIECKLLETMQEIFIEGANYIFFTCVDPFESSMKHSMKALKYANRLRHLILNTDENAKGDINNSNSNNDRVKEVNYDNSDDEYNNILQQQQKQHRQIPQQQQQQQQQQQSISKIINPNASIPFNQINQSQSVNNSSVVKESNSNHIDHIVSPVIHQRNQSTNVDNHQRIISNSYIANTSPRQSQKEFLIQKYQHLVNQMPNQNSSNVNKTNFSNDSYNPISNTSNQMRTIQSTEQFIQDEYGNQIQQPNQYANSNNRSNLHNMIQSSPIEARNTKINISYDGPNQFNSQSQSQNHFQLQNDNSTLISDNIILKEDIQRLSSLNNRKEEELELERRHRVELENRILQLQKEKEMFESDLNQMIKQQQEAIEEEASETMYTKMSNRLLQERKISKLANDNTTLKIANDKLETENKIMAEQLSELRSNYNKSNTEFAIERVSHNKSVEQIELKIEAMTNELYNIQSENKYLRSSEEKTRFELDKAIRERESFKEKYLKHKERNATLENQLKLNESQMHRYTIENKLKQNMNEEGQKMKYDTKTKIVSDLKSKTDNLRSMIYKNRINESIE